MLGCLTTRAGKSYQRICRWRSVAGGVHVKRLPAGFSLKSAFSLSLSLPRSLGMQNVTESINAKRRVTSFPLTQAGLSWGHEAKTEIACF